MPRHYCVQEILFGDTCFDLFQCSLINTLECSYVIPGMRIPAHTHSFCRVNLWKHFSNCMYEHFYLRVMICQQVEYINFYFVYLFSLHFFEIANNLFTLPSYKIMLSLD